MSTLSLHFSDAFRAGFRLAARAPGLVALGVLAEGAARVLSFGSALALGALVARAGMAVLNARGPTALMDPGSAGRLFVESFVAQRALLPVAGAGLVALLLRELLWFWWVGAAGRLFSERLSGESSGFSLERASAALLRAVPALALVAVGSLAALLLGVTVVGSAAAYYAHAFARGQGGLGAAAAFAFALTLGLLLQKATSLFARLTVLRAASEPGPVTGAVLRTARFLGARLPAVVGTALIFGLLQGVLGAGRGFAGLFLDGGDNSTARVLALALGGMLDLGLVLVGAFLASAELGTLVALGAGGAQEPERASPPETLPHEPAAAPAAPSEAPPSEPSPS